jgi:predicted outer membrane protein
MGAEHQRIYDDLAKLRGSAFDRAYAQAMVRDHQEGICSSPVLVGARREASTKRLT